MPAVLRIPDWLIGESNHACACAQALSLQTPPRHLHLWLFLLLRLNEANHLYDVRGIHAANGAGTVA
jgi:hypothetical protein